MENLERHQREYPLFLKVLLGFGALFLGSLGILLLSMLLSMLGFAYGLPNLMDATVIMEQLGIGMLGSSILLGGGISIIGLMLDGAPLSKTYMPEQNDKLKNEDRQFDIREHGLSVEDVLADMSMSERELLAEKLAESRLAIREDGILIPLEQAEKLQRIERFTDG